MDWWEGGIYVGLYGLYIMFMAHNEFFMRKMDLLWPERAKTLMELNKNLQTEKKASQAESGKRRAAVARNGRAKTGQRRTYRRFLRRKRRQTSGEKVENVSRKFSKRLGKIQTIASVLVLDQATFRRVQFVRCDQTRL